MEIFDRRYYPDDLSDWWMDDWITNVYGHARTKVMPSIEVVHHAETTKYAVDRAHYRKLRPLIRKGKQRVRNWVAEHATSPAVSNM